MSTRLKGGAWNLEIKITINEPKITEKVTNDKFGLFVSQSWKGLIDPYTPRDTGLLMGASGNTVDILPFKLHYKEPYAEYQYKGISKNGKPFDYQKKNPFSTDHWDIKAAEAGQLNKLYQSINNYLRR